MFPYITCYHCSVRYKAPVKTRAVNSDGDSMRKHASMSYDKGIIVTNLHH